MALEENIISAIPNDFPNDSSDNQPPNRGKEERGNKKSKTPTLDQFSTDLTKLAFENKIDPVIGREKEIERMCQILGRRKKNNPVLIGDPGVGKTSIVEGLALKIAKKEVSKVLINKRVVSLDISSVVAGTQYRGQFEERMKTIIDEIKKSNDIILFIDELHTIVGAGSTSGSLDASNIFKPALSRGEIRLIGATTLNEYRENIEYDGALERRFQKIIVEPTSPEVTLEILNNVKDKYEVHHKVKYTNEAIEGAVKLGERYMHDRNFPDKAFDLIDEAGSRVHMDNIGIPPEIKEAEKEREEIVKLKQKAVVGQQFEDAARYRDDEKKILEKIDELNRKWEMDLDNDDYIPVSFDDIASVVSTMTNIPVKRLTQSESQKYLNLDKELNNIIIGQEEAIDKITRSLKRSRVNIKRSRKPIGSFLFVGDTGVGKTYLAKCIAKYIFENEDALIRIDMSEYGEKFNVSRLIGAPPGYVGYEAGGQLTEKVRRKPYSVILFDEIEKAHPDIFDIFLQILDEGFVTDSLGRKIDFRNTIIILTSNIGTKLANEYNTGVGFESSTKTEEDKTKKQNIIKKTIEKKFKPEFINRLSDTIFFNPLNEDNISQILNLELDKLRKILKEDHNIEFNISENMLNLLKKEGYDEKWGARELSRKIEKRVEDIITDWILMNESSNHKILNLNYNAEQDEVCITTN